MNKHLTIFYAVRNVGGAQLLFARLAAQLQKSCGWKVQLVDYEDGFIRKHFIKFSIVHDFIVWNDGDKVNLSDTTLLLGFGELPQALPVFSANKNINVLLWSVHPHNVLAYFRFGFIYRRIPLRLRAKLSSFLEPLTRKKTHLLMDYLNRNNSLIFMDKPNSLYAQCMFSFQEAKYLAIPISMETPEINKERTINKKSISVGWLGRLDNNKYNSIVASLNSCSMYSEKYDCELYFHIIGDGAALEKLKNSHFSGVKLIFPGVLLDDSLSDYLVQNFQVGFAMGTSVLEISKHQIPSVITDYSTKPIPCKEIPYRWFYDSNELDVGEVYGEVSRKPSISIEDILYVATNKKMNNLIGKLCADKAYSEYEIENVAEKLIDYIDSSKSSFSEIKSLLGK